MTMHPFLTGFWLSSATSAGVIFALIHMHRAQQSLQSFPAWATQLAVALIFFSPILGIGCAWLQVCKKRHLRSVHSLRHRCLCGAGLGAVIVISIGYILAPVILR